MEADENEKLIATLIHISDLHFGDKFTTDETLLKKLLMLVPFLRGTYAHSYEAARALAVRVNQILKNRKEKEIPAGVVFTGDLTSSGEKGEFLVGTTFLRGAHWTGAKWSVGLNLGEDRPEIDFKSSPALFFVPGNHDIWQRKKPDVLGAYGDHFPGPFPKQWKVTTQKRPIFLHGLDSTQNTLLKHRLARGRVPSEHLDELCNRLEQLMLKKDSKDGIHIILLHHPLIDPKEGGWDPTLELEDRQAIAQRLSKLGAHMVLAGHVHQQLVLTGYHQNSDLCGYTLMPNHAIAGTATQMFSEECNFLLLDIFVRKIRLQVFKYSKKTGQFDVNSNKDHAFTLMFRCYKNS